MILAVWFLCLAIGPQIYTSFQSHLAAWYGQLALLAFAFSFYYHLANGIRHLFWDAGLGLEIESSYKSGYVVIATSLILTAASCYIALVYTGGAA